MDKLAKLTADIGRLWETYSGAYFTGIRNTLVLAVVATLIGCVIGLGYPDEEPAAPKRKSVEDLLTYK